MGSGQIRGGAGETNAPAKKLAPRGGSGGAIAPRKLFQQGAAAKIVETNSKKYSKNYELRSLVGIEVRSLRKSSRLRKRVEFQNVRWNCFLYCGFLSFDLENFHLKFFLWPNEIARRHSE